MSITTIKGATMFTDESVNVFAMVTIKHAIKLYAKTGMRVNRAYTPTAMKRTAEQMTGKTFKRGDWSGMIVALDAVIEDAKRERG